MFDAVLGDREHRRGRLRGVTLPVDDRVLAEQDVGRFYPGSDNDERPVSAAGDRHGSAISRSSASNTVTAWPSRSTPSSVTVTRTMPPRLETWRPTTSSWSRRLAQ